MIGCLGYLPPLCVNCDLGGVGFDINCGVRLVRTNLFEKDIKPIQEQITQVWAVQVWSCVGMGRCRCVGMGRCGYG